MALQTGALTLWAAAFGANALGLLLIYLRDSIPAVLSYSIANTLVVASAQLFLAGVCIFKGRRTHARTQVAVTAGALAAVAALFTWSTYFVAVAVITALIVLYEGMAVFVLMQQTRPGMRCAQRIVAAAFGLEILVLGLRIPWLLWPPANLLFVILPFVLLDRVRGTGGFLVNAATSPGQMRAAVILLFAGSAVAIGIAIAVFPVIAAAERRGSGSWRWPSRRSRCRPWTMAVSCPCCR